MFRCFFMPGNMQTDIRFKSELAGGAMMDLGCYCVNVLMYFGGGVAEVTKAVPVLHETDKNIDIAMRATMNLQSGAEATLFCGFMSTVIPTIEVTIKAEKGSVHFNNFVRPDIFHSITVTLFSGGKHSETVYGENGRTTYSYQLEKFCEGVRRAKVGEGEGVGVDDVWTGVDEGVKIMKVLDRVYEVAGLTPRMKVPK